MTAWILSLMVMLQPAAPWRASYEVTAAAIDRAAHAAPLYAGDEGIERTAADLVALTWFESRFDPNAIGDHGRSLGLAQIGVSNLNALRLGRDALFDIDANLRAALQLMKISHLVCRVRPKEERLSHYASGGGDCVHGTRESVHRTKLAARLLARHRVYWTERRRDVREEARASL